MTEEQQETVTTEAVQAPDAVPFYQPERGQNESQDDYRARRKMANTVIRNQLKRGSMYHDSARLGTYVKSA